MILRTFIYLAWAGPWDRGPQHQIQEKKTPISPLGPLLMSFLEVDLPRDYISIPQLVESATLGIAIVYQGSTVQQNRYSMKFEMDKTTKF